VKFLTEANQQECVLTFAEQRKYLAGASPTLAAVAGLILETGMRPEEVFTLQTTSLRLDDRFLKIVRGKTPAARRRIDLTDAAMKILKARMALAAELKTTYLFPCDADSERPLPGIQSAHARHSKRVKSLPSGPMIAPHLGHTGSRGWN
jgi:integrase